jgi:hypothetical protein
VARVDPNAPKIATVSESESETRRERSQLPYVPDSEDNTRVNFQTNGSAAHQ